MQPTEELDLHLLREIASNPQASQRGLAKRLGVSLGRVNYCLRALSSKGWVKARNFQRSDNKWAYAYMLTPSGAQEKLRLTLSFLQRKMADYDRLQDEIAQLRREIDDLPRSN